MRYRDRADAGKRLADALSDHLAGLRLPPREEPPLVLGVARGGVPVAAEVADALEGELDVAVARKLGAPGNPELAVGAVTVDGDPYVDRALLARLGIHGDYIEEEAARQSAEVQRRIREYRAGEPPEPHDRITIIVDDGIATGSTVLVVARWAKQRGAARVVVAVPVGPPESLAKLELIADDVVCPLRPRHFFAVGEWYDDFTQVGDDEVAALLTRHRDRPSG